MSKQAKHKNLLDDFNISWTIADQTDLGTAGILVTIDATHAGYVNRNYYNYSAKSMRRAVNSWTKPFAKPLLKNHDRNSEPLGRVTSARYIGNDKKGFIQLDVLVTDQDAVEKIKDQRYLTVSTSGDPVEYVRCSICGQDHLSSSVFCGHKRGSIYEDEETGKAQRCYWEIGELRYKEISIVQDPADIEGEESAAMITSWKFQDEEGSIPVNKDTTNHKGIVHMKEKLWVPETDAQKKELVDLLKSGVQLASHQELFDSFGSDIDPLDVIDQYVEQGGKFKPIPIQLSDEESDLAKSLSDALSESGSVFLTNKAEDDRRQLSHRHVVYTNAAGNGFTDYVLGHGHEVVDNKLVPAQKRTSDPEGNITYVDGHSHKIEGEAIAPSSLDQASDSADPDNPFAAISDDRILLAIDHLRCVDASNTLQRLAQRRAVELGYSDIDAVLRTMDIARALRETI